ncbi:MAG: DUF1799 domain-containing protein [Pseudomonadales bacterium]|jgi:hypothetical protein|nr:DUF1799 domain-containing protein [Pseudomonadales bacterium]
MMVGFDLFALAQEEETPIWPENELAYNTFTRLLTQWRVGLNGATGLDYTAVLAFIRTLRLPRVEADELFADIQLMESWALAALAEKDK